LVKEEKENFKNHITNTTGQKGITEDRGDKTLLFFMKKRYIRIIEKFFNDKRKDKIEFYYGLDSRIKVNNIYSNVKGDVIMVDVTIVLGEVITEETLDRSLVDYLMEEIIEIIFPDTSIKVLLNWDVN
jgi:hypothetical protein